MTKHDPKWDPRPGDILRYGLRYCETYVEVLPHDPKFAPTDVSYVAKGREGQQSIRQWRRWAKKAKVIHAAE